MTSRRTPHSVSAYPALRARQDRRAVKTTDTLAERVDDVVACVKALGELAPRPRSIDDIPDWVLAGG